MPQWLRLRLPRISQSQLIGARGPHKLGQADGLRLPSETANPAVRHPQHTSHRRALVFRRGQSPFQTLDALVGNDVAVRNIVDQPGAEQSRRLPLRNIDALREGHSAHAILRQHGQTRKWWKARRQAKMNMAESLLELGGNGLRMDDPLSRFLAQSACIALRPHREQVDIVFERATSPGAPLPVTFDARFGVEDRAQSVSPICQRVPRGPLVQEQFFSRLRRRRIDGVDPRPQPIPATID